MNEMIKNLVIIHLESLSNFIFNMNRDCFPNLNQWAEKMEYFPNYYSTATSTQMVISDLFMGNMDVFESASYLENIYEVKHSETPILMELRNKGYVTKYYDFGDGKNELKVFERFHNNIDSGGDYFFGHKRELFSCDVKSFLKENQNRKFALYIKDISSHLSSKTDDYDKSAISPKNWFKERYKSIDKTVGMVFDVLLDNNLLDNTIVLLYGDHGDEPYSHSFHQGYFHAIEPFNDMINCPLFIFDVGKETIINKHIVSTVDIKDIIKMRLSGKRESYTRRYSFSRNLLAAQTRKADVFNKAYSVTDGEYSLMITQDGLSLFMNCIDPLNLNNLLDFFEIKSEDIVYNNMFDDVNCSHYMDYMNGMQKKSIIKEFKKLFLELKKRVCSQKYLSEEFPFYKINYRINKNEIPKSRRNIKGMIYVFYVYFRQIVNRLFFNRNKV